MIGVEPIMPGPKPGVLPLHHISLCLEREKGFEPSPSVWKTDVLTVKHYSRTVVTLAGLEPT